MIMKFPKKIVIGKTRYAIVRKTTRLSDLGCINFAEKTIYLSVKDARGNRLLNSEREETFWHEVIHGVLYDMKHKLCYNEQFVTMFARRLSGAIKSAKF